MTRRDALKFAALAIGSACARSGPESIAYDADVCAYCRMTISDPRFGAAIVTLKGRTLDFDSIDCLVSYWKSRGLDEHAASAWVADFRRPGTLIEAAGARFIDLGGGRAPMGGRRGIAAVRTDVDAAALGIRDTRSWAQLL